MYTDIDESVYEPDHPGPEVSPVFYNVQYYLPLYKIVVDGDKLN